MNNMDTKQKPKQKKTKAVTEARTNRASIAPHFGRHIYDWYALFEGLVDLTFSIYLTECGTFGPRGSAERKKATSRRKYLDRLRTQVPIRKFHEILSAQLKADCLTYPFHHSNALLERLRGSPNQGPRLLPSTPDLPFREQLSCGLSLPARSDSQPYRPPATTSFDTSELEPQQATTSFDTSVPIRPPAATASELNQPATTTAGYNMDHLAPQVKADVHLDFDQKEKNEGVWPFRSDRLAYRGERISFMNFMLPVSDPRDLMHVSVTFLPDKSGFKLRKSEVSDSFVGDDEKFQVITNKMEKQPRKLMELDQCSEDDANNIIAGCAQSFIVFCHSMEENTSSRFSERTYYFPAGVKARGNLMGNTGTTVQIHLNVTPFSFGTKKKRSYAACAHWIIPLDLPVEKITSDKRQSKQHDLDEALEG